MSSGSTMVVYALIMHSGSISVNAEYLYELKNFPSKLEPATHRSWTKSLGVPGASCPHIGMHERFGNDAFEVHPAWSETIRRNFDLVP